MQNAFIYDGIRTPFGRDAGCLSGVRPDDLLADTIAELFKRGSFAMEDVEDVIMGCTNQAGEDTRNVARMALLLAGMPQTVPGVTLNRLCASGLEAVNQAARAAECGDGSVYIAGGVESMSRAPYVFPRGSVAPKAGNITGYDTCLGWRFPNPKMEAMFPLEAMGCTAENLVDRYGLSREEQDLYALASHEKAIRATDEGWMAPEIAPVSVPQRKRDPVVVSQDEGPRRGSTMEKLARLRPAFRKGGSVTAANSSTLNDGSAALLVTTAARARELGLRPRFRVVAKAAAGVDPTVMGIGPVPATKKALSLAGWTTGDLDVIELNEAFASQSIAVIRELELDPARVNLHGGAIALGHPLGCSGARILTTLMGALDRTGGDRGLATLCVGVGQGVSTLIERC